MFSPLDLRLELGATNESDEIKELPVPEASELSVDAAKGEAVVVVELKGDDGGVLSIVKPPL